MQAWEALASAWVPSEEIAPEVKELREKVREAYRAWKTDHPNYDPNGYWGSRVTSPFGWSSLKAKLDGLVKLVGINSAKIGLDFDQLKSARDSVAHTGVLPDGMVENRRDTFSLLKSAQRGLQILLLAELAYEGLVIDDQGEYTRYEPIFSFLKSSS